MHHRQHGRTIPPPSGYKGINFQIASPMTPRSWLGFRVTDLPQPEPSMVFPSQREDSDLAIGVADAPPPRRQLCSV